MKKTLIRAAHPIRAAHGVSGKTFPPRSPLTSCAALIGCVLILLVEIVFADYTETVEQLVKRLGSPVLTERDDTQQKLFLLGPEIKKLLPDDASVSPEVRVRLKNLRRVFLWQSIDQSLGRVQFTLESLTLQETQNQKVARLMVDWSDSVNAIRPIRWRFPLDFLGQSGVYDIPVAPEQTRVPIRFSWRAVAGEEEKPFHGKCSLLFAAGVYPFTFSLEDNAVRIVRHESAVVSIQRIVYDQRAGRLTIRFLVEYDNALDAMQSHLVWMESNLAHLEKENGQVILPDGPVQQVEKFGNRFVGILSFRIPRGIPWKTLRFVYQAPTILTERAIEF